MHRKSKKEKLIGGDKIITKTFRLIPNELYGLFIIGDDINNYFHLPYEKMPNNEDDRFYIEEGSQYIFFDGLIDIWTISDKIKNEIIGTIKCTIECFWNGENLIGMPFDKFLVVASQQYDHEDIIYVPISRDRGQNQRVYTFYDLGLQIWGWRNKIRTVLISNYDED